MVEVLDEGLDGLEALFLLLELARVVVEDLLAVLDYLERGSFFPSDLVVGVGVFVHFRGIFEYFVKVLFDFWTNLPQYIILSNLI